MFSRMVSALKLKQAAKNIRNLVPKAGRYCSWPAGIIDRLYLRESNSWLSSAWTFLATRLVYIGLFLPLLIIDTIAARLKSAFYFEQSNWLTDQAQDNKLQKQKEYASLFSKNLYPLLSCVMGLFSPKLITFYFIPEKPESQGVSAGGGLHHAPLALRLEPNSVEEIQNILRTAEQDNIKVIPVGAGRSQGKQFLPEGKKAQVVDLKNLNQVLHFDKANKTITVGAGMKWHEIQDHIDKSQLALQVMQASNVFSVGGSVGTNIHGWDHINGSLSNTILSMDIVTPQGEVKQLTPQDELFHLVTGGLGLYGIVTSVKLKLTDNIMLNEIGADIKPAHYVKHFREKVQTQENIRMHLYRLSLDPKNLLGSGVAVDYVAAPNASQTRTPELTQEDKNGTRFNRIMINLARRFAWLRGFYWNKMESKRLLANNSPAMTTNAIMQPPINAMFNNSVSEAEWLQEYFIPGENLDAFLKNLGKILMDNEVPLLNASVRFVKQNNKSPLSYAYKGDRFAVVLCFNQSLHPEQVIKAKKWIRESQETTIKCNGSFYLPYQQVSHPVHFDASYPGIGLAMQAKKEHDPEEILSSGLYERYFKDSYDYSYFHTLMQHPSNKDRFKGFLKNVFQQVDADKLYNLLADIMTYNDSHAEIYAELCNRLKEILPSGLGSMRRVLSSLSDIKRDLSVQAKNLLGDRKEINGLVEIGYPGRFVAGFKQNFKVKGSVVAVHEQQSLTDYIQTAGRRPNDRFVALDYLNPELSLKQLKDGSADVITCYVGLHHFPDDKLGPFLTELRRVLSPQGRFLLMDHDVSMNADEQCMASMAHTIFNAVNGVSLEDEMSEIRHFRPISYWQEKLAEFGLPYQSEGSNEPQIRKGDPSRNRMVCFAKGPVLVKDIQKEEKAEKAPEEVKSIQPPQNDAAPEWKEKNASTQNVSSSGLGLMPGPRLTQSTRDSQLNKPLPNNDKESLRFS